MARGRNSSGGASAGASSAAAATVEAGTLRRLTAAPPCRPDPCAMSNPRAEPEARPEAARRTLRVASRREGASPRLFVSRQFGRVHGGGKVLGSARKVAVVWCRNDLALVVITSRASPFLLAHLVLDERARVVLPRVRRERVRERGELHVRHRAGLPAPLGFHRPVAHVLVHPARLGEVDAPVHLLERDAIVQHPPVVLHAVDHFVVRGSGPAGRTPINNIRREKVRHRVLGPRVRQRDVVRRLERARLFLPLVFGRRVRRLPQSAEGFANLPDG
mmetsp:Transcript_335/g.1277  ORF Transcript_335/g.1277 Transcript_335/m.1277 type:complete len:275 (-) Transcript_335:1314-2138(-)